MNCTKCHGSNTIEKEEKTTKGHTIVVTYCEDCETNTRVVYKGEARYADQKSTR